MTIEDEIEKSTQLIRFCRELFKTSNLIPTDFEDISILKVDRPFSQGMGGVHVQFSVSRHLINKASQETRDARDCLLKDTSTGDRDD